MLALLCTDTDFMLVTGCFTSQGQEYELNDDMKDLSFYSVSSGDAILLRW